MFKTRSDKISAGHFSPEQLCVTIIRDAFGVISGEVIIIYFLNGDFAKARLKGCISRKVKLGR